MCMRLKQCQKDLPDSREGVRNPKCFSGWLRPDDIDRGYSGDAGPNPHLILVGGSTLPQCVKHWCHPLFRSVRTILDTEPHRHKTCSVGTQITVKTAEPQMRCPLTRCHAVQVQGGRKALDSIFSLPPEALSGCRYPSCVFRNPRLDTPSHKLKY